MTAPDCQSSPQHPTACKQVCIVYHSPYGHTERVAQAIAGGARQVANTQVHVMPVDHVDWHALDHADLIIFGSPTYMGSVTSGFKLFMDATSKRWKNRLWVGKMAAGFANSGGLSGDKLAVLQQICLFAMQHGMLWSGLPLIPTGHAEHDLNRLSGFLGLMTQSNNAPVTETPPTGDIATATWFGQYLSELIHQ
ncbi:flavodoxin family protein [Alkanindiges sp. WGS2144]|uniref:flavodoxin family protein n=1 Tax=Alkanindiges sp. WGS2144 TaxID=3366808 RepID=UPI0037513B4E